VNTSALAGAITAVMLLTALGFTEGGGTASMTAKQRQRRRRKRSSPCDRGCQRGLTNGVHTLFYRFLAGFFCQSAVWHFCVRSAVVSASAAPSGDRTSGTRGW
jgi:hypothetical protein